jgi:hypothetical protein
VSHHFTGPDALQSAISDLCILMSPIKGKAKIIQGEGYCYRTSYILLTEIQSMLYYAAILILCNRPLFLASVIRVIKGKVVTVL